MTCQQSKKKNNEFGFKVVTVEEVSDDDLPEVIEHRTHKEKQSQDNASDVDSNYSMVSNNSLSPENCQISDKEKKAKSETKIQQNREPTEKDEISSLSREYPFSFKRVSFSKSLAMFISSSIFVSAFSVF